MLHLRTVYLKRRLVSCGQNVVVAQGAILRYPENLSVGSNVFINRGTSITARAPISIGDDVLIGPYVIIDSGDHDYQDATKSINTQGYLKTPIKIESDIWIGANAVILRGVTLGHGCVVAAGAVVNKSVTPFTVVGGVLARKIGRCPREFQ